jgi:hypothetical protein
LQIGDSLTGAALVGHIIYQACLIFFWITLNCCTLFFGVFVEPLWRDQPKFRLLQFPGRIPCIAIALPILLAYAAYRTFQLFGIWHVLLPFAAIGIAAPLFVGSLMGFNAIRQRDLLARVARGGGALKLYRPAGVPILGNQASDVGGEIVGSPDLGPMPAAKGT